MTVPAKRSNVGRSRKQLTAPAIRNANAYNPALASSNWTILSGQPMSKLRIKVLHNQPGDTENSNDTRSDSTAFSTTSLFYSLNRNPFPEIFFG